MTADHCEVRLAALRRTKDGTVVSFLLHPSEIPDCLLLDPLGQRYMIGIAAIGDDEQPTAAAQQPPPPSTAVVPERAENRDAALWQEEMDVADKNAWEAGAYSHVPKPADAAIVKRAGILSSDKRFWAWINVTDAEAAAAFIRRACAVVSRRDLATNTGAAIRFQGLLDEYLAETGQRAEIRG